MLNSAIKEINDSMSSLCWVDNLCGLSTLAKRVTESKQGKVTQVYPVSCDCDQNNCWTNGNYKDLVPNGNFKSTVYWDQTGSVSQVLSGRSAKFIKFESTLKLVMWFNLKKLGKESCGFCYEVYNDLVLMFSNQIQSSNPEIGGIKIESLEMDSQETTRQFFRKYQHGEKERIFFYPYEACTFNIKLSWIASKKCLNPAVCGVEIEC